jgi:hypothetical protein
MKTYLEYLGGIRKVMYVVDKTWMKQTSRTGIEVVCAHIFVAERLRLRC